MSISHSPHFTVNACSGFPTSLLYDEFWTESWQELPKLPPQVEAIAEEILDEEIARLAVLITERLQPSQA